MVGGVHDVFVQMERTRVEGTETVSGKVVRVKIVPHDEMIVGELNVPTFHWLITLAVDLSVLAHVQKSLKCQQLSHP